MNNFLSVFSSITSDTLILAAAVCLFIFLGIRFGKNSVISVIFSLYFASFLYSNVFFVQNLVFVKGNPTNLFWNHLAIYLLFFIPIYLIVSRIISYHDGHRGLNLIKVIILAVVSGGLLISIFYHLIPINPIYNFSPAVDDLFTSAKAFTLWLLLPLIVLFF